MPAAAPVVGQLVVGFDTGPEGGRDLVLGRALKDGAQIVQLVRERLRSQKICMDVISPTDALEMIVSGYWSNANNSLFISKCLCKDDSQAKGQHPRPSL